jgi:predicted NAD/FAD-dependent oxidoreductase
MDRPRVAIIGAGPAGLAAAWRLRDAPVEVVVVDKSRGVSGRAASRTRHGARFDFGANYFKLDTPELERLVLQELPGEGLVRIAGDVWTFDGAGRIAPGDPVQNRQAKWTYSSGISTLGKHLAAAARADVRFATRVTALRRATGAWQLVTEDPAAGSGGAFDAVLLTAPAPQAREILAASEITGAELHTIDASLAAARYHQQWCFALGFQRSIEPRPECFALINSDRSHAIAWLSFENDKPGRELGGSTVIMVQMSPAWSARHFDASAETLLPEVHQAALSLLGLEDRPVEWFDSQRWRFAHTYQAAEANGLAGAESAGLFFAGDALVGKGRVGASMTTGLRAAERITARLC